MRHAKINWSPFSTNILDAEKYALCTPDGKPVDFHRDNCGRDFVLIIGGKRFETGDNLKMSYWMNQFSVGGLLNWRDEIDEDEIRCRYCEKSFFPRDVFGETKCPICGAE